MRSLIGWSIKNSPGLNIVVDDAIVVGENIFSHQQIGKNDMDAALDGAAEMMPSVFALVKTTVIAFAPLLFVAGMMGKLTAVMPAAPSSQCYWRRLLSA